MTTVLGPTFYGYADEESLDSVASDARLLTEDDAAAYEQLRKAVPDDEWANGAPQFDYGRTVVLLAGNELVAAAGYEVWDDFLAHISVVVHPNHRGAGYGRQGRFPSDRANPRRWAPATVPDFGRVAVVGRVGREPRLRAVRDGGAGPVGERVKFGCRKRIIFIAPH